MMQWVAAAINVLREEHQNQPRPKVGVGVAPAGLSNVQSPGRRLYLPAELHKTRTNIVTLLFPLWQSSTNTFFISSNSPSRLHSDTPDDGNVY